MQNRLTPDQIHAYENTLKAIYEKLNLPHDTQNNLIALNMEIVDTKCKWIDSLEKEPTLNNLLKAMLFYIDRHKTIQMRHEKAGCTPEQFQKIIEEGSDKQFEAIISDYFKALKLACKKLEGTLLNDDIEKNILLLQNLDKEISNSLKRHNINFEGKFELKDLLQIHETLENEEALRYFVYQIKNLINIKQASCRHVKDFEYLGKLYIALTNDFGDSSPLEIARAKKISTILEQKPELITEKSPNKTLEATLSVLDPKLASTNYSYKLFKAVDKSKGDNRNQSLIQIKHTM